MKAAARQKFNRWGKRMAGEYPQWVSDCPELRETLQEEFPTPRATPGEDETASLASVW